MIRSTWSELATRGFVSISPGAHSGAVPKIQLLREDGSGKPYTIPDGSRGDTYRRVPEVAWRRLLPDEDLTGPGLAMYLVALRTAARAQRLTDLTFPRSYFQTEYGLGESTRKRGLSNLTSIGVLDVRLVPVDAMGDVGQRRRRRNVYDLLDAYAPPPPPRQQEPDSSIR